MAKIELTSDELIIHVTGWDVVLALRSTVRVPLAHVAGATARPADAHFDGMKGIRLGGGYWPGSFAAGYFWVTGSEGETRQASLHSLEAAERVLSSGGADPSGSWGRALDQTKSAIATVKQALGEEGLPELEKYLAFYDVHNPDEAIGIDVRGEKVKRLVIQIEGETPDQAVLRIREAIAKR